MSAGISSDTVLVTGGAGFIGCNFVRAWVLSGAGAAVTLDKLTYATGPANLDTVTWHPRHVLVRGDICDADLVAALLERHRPRAIVHLAAESHVDHSIRVPGEFITTNVVGTFQLLDCAYRYWTRLDAADRSRFRFLQVSTDEVYGSLDEQGAAFCESTAYLPSSPYSASKAGADHLVRAYQRTYGLPTLITHCSNNYGPHQFPDKLIPLTICNALAGKPLPVYGDGLQSRDWLYVDDHCEALRAVLERGQPGETYNIGSGCEMRNLDLVRLLCAHLDELLPQSEFCPHAQLIRFVADRPGHDRRYAVSTRKIERQLGWFARETFDRGLRRTMKWYLANRSWMQAARAGAAGAVSAAGVAS